MSPRRRLFLALAVATCVVVLLAGLLASRHQPTGPTVAQDRPGPVVLVPGYGNGREAVGELAARLRAAGRTAVVVPLPGDATGDLRTQAATVEATVEPLLSSGAPSVDLVGFSAGGVVVRLWFAAYDGGSKARRVVTLGSPHHGTTVASLALALAPGACPPACQELAPDATLLRDLNSSDETPGATPWTSVWTSADALVTPPETARLQGALDVRLQSVCPDARTAHGDLPRDPLVQGIVLRALAVAPLAAVGPGDCAALRAVPLSADSLVTARAHALGSSYALPRPRRDRLARRLRGTRGP